MISRVLLYSDGFVLVYNTKDALLPDYCGEFNDVAVRIIADAPLTAQFFRVELICGTGSVTGLRHQQHPRGREFPSTRRLFWGTLAKTTRHNPVTQRARLALREAARRVRPDRAPVEKSALPVTFSRLQRVDLSEVSA